MILRGKQSRKVVLQQMIIVFGKKTCYIPEKILKKAIFETVGYLTECIFSDQYFATTEEPKGMYVQVLRM